MPVECWSFDLIRLLFINNFTVQQLGGHHDLHMFASIFAQPSPPCMVTLVHASSWLAEVLHGLKETPCVSGATATSLPSGTVWLSPTVAADYPGSWLLSFRDPRAPSPP